MFSDPFIAVMVLVILSFAGMVLAFLFLLRTLDEHAKALHELNENMETRLMDMQQSLADMAQLMQRDSRENALESLQEPGAELHQMLDDRLSALEDFRPGRKLDFEHFDEHGSAAQADAPLRLDGKLPFPLSPHGK